MARITTSSLSPTTPAMDPSSGSRRRMDRGTYDDAAIGVIASGDTAYVAGSLLVDHSTDIYIFDAATIAYDAISGSRRWMAQYDIIGGTSAAKAVAGVGTTVYMAGFARGADGALGSFTVAYGGEYGRPALGGERPPAPLLGVHRTEFRLVGPSSWWEGTRMGPDTERSLTRRQTVRESWMTPSALSALSNRVELVASPTLDTVYMAGTATWHRGDHFLVTALDARSGVTDWRAVYDNPRGRYDYPGCTGGQCGWNAAVRHRRQPESAATTPRIRRLRTTPGRGNVSGSQSSGDSLGATTSRLRSRRAPDGNGVYVTGESEAATGWDDFATIKYATT